MAGSTTGFPIVLNAHVNYKDFGWDEDYHIAGGGGMTLQQAAVKAKDLLQRRVFWLGLGATLDYASVSLINSDQDSLMVDMYRYQGFPDVKELELLQSVGPMNDRCTGLEFRFETSASSPAPGLTLPRRSGQRIIRGVPDVFVNNVAMTLDPLIDVPLVAPALGSGLPAIAYANTLDGNGNWKVNFPNPAQDLFKVRASFLTALLAYCGIVVKVGSNHPAPYTDLERGNWRVNQYTRCVYRQVSDRRTGGPFGSVRARAKKSY